LLLRAFEVECCFGEEISVFDELGWMLQQEDDGLAGKIDFALVLAAFAESDEFTTRLVNSSVSSLLEEEKIVRRGIGTRVEEDARLTVGFNLWFWVNFC
jgi:hypothetical protein